METEIVEVKKSDRGFTLVELLIVIVILGILATVTVFAVRGITNQGQDSGLRRRQEDPRSCRRGLHGPERQLPGIRGHHGDRWSPA